MGIDYSGILVKFAERKVKLVEGRSPSALLYMNMVAEEILKLVATQAALEKTFEDVGLPDIMLDCPNCGSAVLLEFKDCPVCEQNLVSGISAVVSEDLAADQVAPEPEVKAEKKKVTKKTKEPKVTQAPVPSQEEQVAEATEPVKPARAEKQIVPPIKQYPSETELKAADYKTLRQYAETFNLKTSHKDFKQLTPYREAMMKEVSGLRPAVTPSKVETLPAKAKSGAAKKAKGKTPVANNGGDDGGDSKGDMGVLDKAVKQLKAKSEKKKKEEPKVEEEDQEPLEEVDSDFDFEDSEPEDVAVDTDDEDEEDDLDFELDDVEEPDDFSIDDDSDDEDDSWDDE